MENTFELRRRTCYGAILEYCIKIQGLDSPSYGFDPTATVGFRTPEGNDYVMHVIYTNDVQKTFNRNITSNEVIQGRITDFMSYWNQVLAFVVSVDMAQYTLPHPEYFATPLQFEVDTDTNMAYIKGLKNLPHRIGLEWSYLS